VVAVRGVGFHGVVNSIVLEKECKKCAHCGYTFDEFFKGTNCGKKCGT
jgi:hypothetical protein